MSSEEIHRDAGVDRASTDHVRGRSERHEHDPLRSRRFNFPRRIWGRYSSAVDLVDTLFGVNTNNRQEWRRPWLDFDFNFPNLHDVWPRLDLGKAAMRSGLGSGRHHRGSGVAVRSQEHGSAVAGIRVVRLSSSGLAAYDAAYVSAAITAYESARAAGEPTRTAIVSADAAGISAGSASLSALPSCEAFCQDPEGHDLCSQVAHAMADARRVEDEDRREDACGY